MQQENLSISSKRITTLNSSPRQVFHSFSSMANQFGFAFCLRSNHFHTINAQIKRSLFNVVTWPGYKWILVFQDMQNELEFSSCKLEYKTNKINKFESQNHFFHSWPSSFAILFLFLFLLHLGISFPSFEFCFSFILFFHFFFFLFFFLFFDENA